MRHIRLLLIILAGSGFLCPGFCAIETAEELLVDLDITSLDAEVGETVKTLDAVSILSCFFSGGSMMSPSGDSLEAVSPAGCTTYSSEDIPAAIALCTDPCTPLGLAQK